jgi:hypothetical protein
VGAEARAKLTFRKQAFCSIGGVPVPTKVITRVGATLFQQISGLASCRGRGAEPFQYDYYCHVDGRCPVRLFANGYFETVWSPPSGHASSLLRSQALWPFPLQGTTRRELNAMICSGAYRLEIVPLGGSRPAQSRSGTVPSESRVYIRVFEERSEDERLLVIDQRTVSGACLEEGG